MREGRGGCVWFGSSALFAQESAGRLPRGKKSGTNMQQVNAPGTSGVDAPSTRAASPVARRQVRRWLELSPATGARRRIPHRTPRITPRTRRAPDPMCRLPPGSPADVQAVEHEARHRGRPCRLGRLADRENRARGRLNTNQLHIRSDRAAQRQDRSPATVGIGEGSAGGPAPARTSSPTFAPGGR